jgi:hypothetical protein
LTSSSWSRLLWSQVDTVGDWAFCKVSEQKISIFWVHIRKNSPILFRIFMLRFLQRILRSSRMMGSYQVHNEIATFKFGFWTYLWDLDKFME